MDYKEKYERLVKQIKMESERADEALVRERDDKKLTTFNCGITFAYDSIKRTIEMLEKQ